MWGGVQKSVSFPAKCSFAADGGLTGATGHAGDVDARRSLRRRGAAVTIRGEGQSQRGHQLNFCGGRRYNGFWVGFRANFLPADHVPV